MLETKLVSEYINAGAQVGNFEVGAQVFIKARIILNIVLAQVSEVLRLRLEPTQLRPCRETKYTG